MAKISALPEIVAPTGTETVPVIVDGTTKRARLKPLVDAAAEASVKEVSRVARGPSYQDTNPNFFTRRELAFADLTRQVLATGFSVTEASGAPAGKLRVVGGSGTNARCVYRFPAGLLKGAATLAASVEIAALGGNASGGSVNFTVSQKRADGSLITEQVVSMLGAAGLASSQTFGAGPITREPACAFIDVDITASSFSSGTRELLFRSMLLASGGEYGFRQPPIDPASPADTAAGTDEIKYVTPAGLRQTAATMIDNRLVEAGLTPDIVDFIIQKSAFDIPAALKWPARWPKTVIGPLLSGGFDFYRARALARSVVPPETWTVPAIHIDPDGGNNANTGATMAAAFKTVPAAVAAGIARGGPIHLVLKAGAVMPRASGFTNVAWGSLAVPLACTVEGGGRAVSSNHDVLTWAVDPTYPNLWSATRSSAGKVFDPSNADADGVYARYTPYATPAALNAAGAVTGYASDATKVYARRADGSAVTNANCRVYLVVVNFEMTNAKASVYLEGIRFEGSSTGPVHFESTADVNFAAVDCFAGYTTRAGGSERDGFRIRNIGGLTLLVNCIAAEIDKDGFNQHVDIGTSLMPGVYVNPKARRIGTTEGGSKNAFTLHETARAIVINPDFPATINGSTIANVGDSKCIVFGGSVRAGPDTGALNGAVALTDNAEIWFVGTEIVGDIVVADNTTVYLRDVRHTGSVKASGAGRVVAF
jgi:hypothetical protein